MYNRKYRLNKKINTLILRELLHDPELQQSIGDVNVDETNKALMNETLHDFESPKLGPTECFSDFPVPDLELDALMDVSTTTKVSV